MEWDDVETLWGDSNINGKQSSTSKDCVEDTGNIVDVYYGHTYVSTWFDVVRRGTIGGGSVRP